MATQIISPALLACDQAAEASDRTRKIVDRVLPMPSGYFLHGDPFTRRRERDALHRSVKARIMARIVVRDGGAA